jgi:hypothetical protein
VASAEAAVAKPMTSTIDLGSNPDSSFSQGYDHPGPGYWRLTYAGVTGLLQPAQTDAMYVA